MDLFQRSVLLVGAGLLALSGCQRAVPLGEAQVHEMTYVSPATPLRQWEPSTAYYASGDVVAGPNLMAFSPAEDGDARLQRASGAPIFLGNVVMMPVEASRRSPWSAQPSTGVQIGPTHSAMPPLPESRHSGLLVEPSPPTTPAE